MKRNLVTLNIYSQHANIKQKDKTQDPEEKFGVTRIKNTGQKCQHKTAHPCPVGGSSNVSLFFISFLIMINADILPLLLKNSRFAIYNNIFTKM